MNELPTLPCYLNGEFTTLRDAKVSVLDRGFVFGDGVYEVVPVYAGKPFRFDEHLARLDRSLGEMRIDNPMTHEQWRELVDKLIAAYAHSTGVDAGSADVLVYIQITRGVAMRDHVMLPGLTPTVFAMVNRMSAPTAQDRSQGVACVTAEDFRWQKANIKSISLASAVLSRQVSADVGALETIMFRNGYLSEGAAVNVWAVKAGKVLGPTRDNLVLEGIRYSLIEQLCRQANIPFELRKVSREEVLAADEIMLSSATKEVLPVTLLDNKPVGNGKPGPIYQKLHTLYQHAKQSA